MTSNMPSFNSNMYYSYQQNFQVAVFNLDSLIREERLLKRLRKAKASVQTPQ